MKTPVKISIKNTSLFDPDLKETLLSACEEPLGSLERETVYSLRLSFDERQIYDKLRVEHFQIPEEALPRYLRGQLLSGKEKVYQLLSYQLNLAIEYLEKEDILLNNCQITGVMDLAPDILEFTLTPMEEPALQPEPASKSESVLRSKSTSKQRQLRDEKCTGKDAGKRKKKEKQIKVISIMPSMTSFMMNLASLGQQREKELIRAVGSAERYKKYESLLGFTRLEEKYRMFKAEYGSIDSFNRSETELLQKKFLEQLEEECRKVKANLKGNSFSDESAEETPEDNAKEENLFLIAGMQVYKLTKAGRRGRVCVGCVDLMSNGRVLRLVCRTTGKAKISQELFEPYTIREETKRTNSDLLQSIRQMTAQADAALREAGFTMETEVIDRLLKFMDLKGVLRNMRKQSILKSNL